LPPHPGGREHHGERSSYASFGEYFTDRVGQLLHRWAELERTYRYAQTYARQLLEEAGFRKKPQPRKLTELDRLRRAWRRASPEERGAFRAEIAEDAGFDEPTIRHSGKSQPNTCDAVTGAPGRSNSAVGVVNPTRPPQRS
jgi:hypothetical protein